MIRLFLSTPHYVQGNGVLTSPHANLAGMGRNGLLISDDVVFNIAGNDYFDFLSESFTITKIVFNGQPSAKEIARMSEIGAGKDIDFVIGMGGGKVLDAAKVVADNLDAYSVIVPTTASMDAPTSRLAVTYHDDGTFDQYLFLKKSPSMIIVDTGIIVKAPTRMLISGISDAMATWIEARGIRDANGKTSYGMYPTITGMAIAEKTEEIIFKYAKLAIDASEKGLVTRAFEDVVEANILLSGLGFESGGIGAGHPIQNALTVVYDKLRPITHGERVSFTAMTQLFMENKSIDVINHYLDFYIELGLPVTLDQLFKEEVTYEDLLEVGKMATLPHEAIHYLALEATPEAVATAMLALDSYATTYQKERGLS